MTYKAMAACVVLPVSASTLKRAASGTYTPSKVTVFTYLDACGSLVDTMSKAMKLLNQTRCEERGGRTRIYVDGINTAAALLDGLSALHRNHGAPKYEEMQARAGGKHLLPLSSISRIRHRQMLPVDEQQMEAFIRGCGVLSDADREQWLNAWRRVKSSDRRLSSLLADEGFDVSDLRVTVKMPRHVRMPGQRRGAKDVEEIALSSAVFG